ncbi:putative diguanylate cyclase AdrA [Candidatus Izimaplasma bacterium HR1]|jgi:diguanylate cyclase (GGDEF)-like protein|uniref:sensor domain-containing diguanylate cyclase n=1 Tax=Candidatus Izimoplasma sp. HR1 TaxID=1541959 RepID=UPI0004F89355|nr:putative diguanylate cyclase AdrA [Candidatus Izimaplasma bacterium HR1]
MNQSLKKPLVFFLVSFIILFVLAIWDYGIFHFAIDFFTIFIGLMMFVLAINSRVYTEKSIYLVLAVSYLYISCFDVLHLISIFDISDMGLSYNESYQYFAIARVFEAFVFVIIFGFIKVPSKVNYKLSHVIAAIVLIVGTLLIHQGVVSVYYIEGVGQSAIKLIVSYMTAALYLSSAYLVQRSKFKLNQKNLLVIVLLLKAFSQVIHASFIDLGDIYQTVAMILRFASYGGLYLIFIREIISSPYQKVYELFESKEQELLLLSERDGLTGLFNHSLTFKNIERMIGDIGRKKYKDLCVILFDIDNFKQINDSFGHIKGDEMLVLFTTILQGIDFKDKMVGRYGGDEFVLAVPDCHKPDIEGIFDVLNVILNEIAEEQGILITFSAGVVLWHMGDNATDLIRKADIKMYESKSKGKNQYTVWQHELKKE